MKHIHRLTVIATLALASVASAADWYSEAAYGRTDYGTVTDTPSTYGVGFGGWFAEYFGAQLDWRYVEQPTYPPCPGPTLCITLIVPQHAEIPVEVFDLGLAGHRGGAIETVQHVISPPRLRRGRSGDGGNQARTPN